MVCDKIIGVLIINDKQAQYVPDIIKIENNYVTTNSNLPSLRSQYSGYTLSKKSCHLSVPSVDELFYVLTGRQSGVVNRVVDTKPPVFCCF